MLKKRTRGVAAAMGVLACCSAFAADYPTRPVRIIIPFAAGGTTDTVVRLYTDQLQKRLGQPFVIEARPGADGMVGSDVALKAPADGYTLLAAGLMTVAAAPLVHSNVPFDPSDALYVAALSENSYLLVVNAAVPVNTLKELIAYAKANPGKLNVSQPGGQFQLDWAVFRKLAGVDLVEIPYKGAAPATAAIAANETQVMIIAPGNAKGFLDVGRLRALAATGERRNPAQPSIPTTAEAGLPEFRSVAGNAFIVHARTSPEIAAKLNTELGAISETPQVRERLAAFGFDPPKRMSVEGLNKHVRSLVDGYREAARAANVVPR